MPCDDCKNKVDIVDLSAPYVIRTCPKCGREIKLREPGDNGYGIKVEKGDRFIFPNGWLKVAANPLKGTGHLTKHGLEWFAKLTFVEEILGKREQFEEVIENNDHYSSGILKQSELIKDLDLDNEDQAEQVFQRLNTNQETIEWWAYLFGTFNAISEDAIKENDAKKAAWAMACAERCRSMIVFKENFEEVVWMGHSARRIVEVIQKWDTNRKNDNEEFWQQIFNENPYVLSQIFSVPVIFIKDKAYVGGMNIDKQDAKFVDYLYTTESSNDALLVEIKTPCTKLLGSKYRKGVFAPSTELAGSIVQVLDYRRELARNIKSITEGTAHEVEVFNPRCIVIVGNYGEELKDELRRKSFELYRTNSRDVEIVTYDELFKKAETLATLFNLVRRKT
jgi:hypothetical protein